MTETPKLPSPSTEQRCIAAEQYERANQVITTKGNFDYGIQLLLDCCKLDPGNAVYRKMLRATQKVKYKNNRKGSRFSTVTTASAKLRLKKALHSQDYLRVLELGEEILSANPWDVGTQMAMGKAFAAFGEYEMAVWTLEQAYEKSPNELKVQRALARMYEKVGNFAHANALWNLIRKADPKDEEAQRKVFDLAANETISKGNYEAVLQTDTHSLDETHPNRPLRFGPEKEPSELSKDRMTLEVEKLRAKLKEEPEEVNHYLQLAQWYRKLGQWDKVRDILQQGLTAVGNDFELAMQLAEARIRPLQEDLAMAQAKLAKQPDDVELKQLRDQLLKEINSRELDIFRQKAERYPTDMSYRLEVGIRLLQSGQTDQAIQELQAARIDPRLHWKALMYLGFCFKTRHNWRLAQRNFEDALRHLPAGEETRRKEILFQLATGCAEANDLNAAMEWGYELANEDFGYKEIGKLLDEWQLALQKRPAE